MSAAQFVDADAALAVLRDVAAIPTAPFHEDAGARRVEHELRQIGLPVQTDPYGNLIATYRSGDSPRPIALVAHLDHPGLEIEAVGSGATARATLLGGVPARCFDRPVPVRIVRPGRDTSARIVGYELDPETGRVGTLHLALDGAAQAGDFGVFDLPDFHRDGSRIALRVADDLAGVAAALLALREVARTGRPGVVYAVFTRAEEVGLVGAALVAEQRLLPPETIVVSLECSRELPGAQAGEGPVIRVGDRTRCFHPEGEALLLAARERIPDAPIQRQLMSGGTCEAVAFGLAGYRTTGVALPLINYHNVGPDHAIAPEIIDLRDFLGEVQLLVAAVEAAPLPYTSAGEKRLIGQVARYRERLRASAGPGALASKPGEETRG